MTKTILVLEDERSLRSAIESSLAKNGFSVLTATNVGDALDIICSAARIDAVWLDHYLLGDRNGLDFLRAIRSKDELRTVPVFVVTNSVSDDKVTTYEVLGIEKYFVKSNNSLSEIISSVKSVIS